MSKIEISKEFFETQNRRFLVLAVAIIICTLWLLLVAIFYKSFVYDKERVVGVNLDIDYQMPLVYSISDFSENNEITKLYEFVNYYVHLMEDESIVNYYAVGKTQRDIFSMSHSLSRASSLSIGKARQLALLKYSNHLQTEKTLREKNKAWEFLIDCISVDAAGLGVYRVTVLGETQVSSIDKAFRIPHESWAYSYIVMDIVAGPRELEEGSNSYNEWGLYVSNYAKGELPPAQSRMSVRGCYFANNRGLDPSKGYGVSSEK